MAILTNDEIAAALFQKNTWAEVSEADRLTITPLISQVEAGINKFIGPTTHAPRIETHRESELTPAVQAVDYIAYRPGIRDMYLRTIPADYLSMVIYEGVDRVELTRGVDYYVDNVDIVNDGGDVRHITHSGKITRGRYGSWSFPVEIQFDGGFNENVAPDSWKLIQMGMTVAVRDQFISQRRSTGLKGTMLPGIIKRENIGEYEYEIDAKASTLGGASGVGAAYGLSPAAVAILWSLRNSARFM